jgi:hypothetical protein
MEVWSGKPATDYDFLHVFGCPAYFHVRESKLDPRAKKALFMGFSDGVKGYRLWCPDTQKVILSRDVTFNESEMLKPYQKEKESTVSKDTQHVEVEVPVLKPVSTGDLQED